MDLIAQSGSKLMPFEFLYAERQYGAKELKDLIDFLKKRKIERGYVVTKGASDFGEFPELEQSAKIMRVPAAFLCYWMGEAESEAN